MSDPEPIRYASAGWYPDGAEKALERWWDGSQWGEETRSLLYIPATIAEKVAAVSPSPSRRASPARSASQFQINPSTFSVWLIALLPLNLGVAAIASFLSGPSSPDTFYLFTSAALTGHAISLFSWMLGAIFALADNRSLGAKGVESPFPWGWALVPFFAPIVYLIGRTVVAKRQTGRGLGPLMLWMCLSASGYLFTGVVSAFTAWLYSPLPI